MVKMRTVHSILVGNLCGKRPRRRPRYRWEDNVV
jgi:hypothetical protein